MMNTTLFGLLLGMVGQSAVKYPPEFFESRLEFVQALPPEQFRAAKQIIFKGGDVSWYSNPSLSITFHDVNFRDEDVSLLLPFRNAPIASLGFLRVKMSEEAIARSFESFPTIKSIYLFEVPAGDRALTPLGSFQDLEYAEFGSSRITSATLRLMAHQSRLEHLSISETQIDDAGLKYLEGLYSLKWLHLGNTQITSLGLKSIGTISNLESLGLNNTLADDDGIKHLAALQKLRSIRLDGTQITNAAMTHIAKLTNLEDLCVERTKVDATGLALLQNMPKLREVRWKAADKATPEEKLFIMRFHLYLPANLERWKEQRAKFERGELKID